MQLEALDVSENWHVTSRGWRNLLGSLGLVTGKMESFVVRDCVLSEVISLNKGGSMVRGGGIA